MVAAFGDEIKNVSAFDRKPCESIYRVSSVFSDVYGMCEEIDDLICVFCFTLASDIRRGRVGRRAGRRPLVSKLYPKVNAKRLNLTETILAL